MQDKACYVRTDVQAGSSKSLMLYAQPRTPSTASSLPDAVEYFEASSPLQ